MKFELCITSFTYSLVPNGSPELFWSKSKKRLIIYNNRICTVDIKTNSTFSNTSRRIVKKKKKGVHRGFRYLENPT